MKLLASLHKPICALKRKFCETNAFALLKEENSSFTEGARQLSTLKLYQEKNIAAL